MGEKRSVTKEMVRRYGRATKKEKGRMLEELSALTGWHRDHARKALRLTRTRSGPPPPASRHRLPVYGAEVMVPLITVWATLNGPCGKRLAPFMTEIVEVLERVGELELTDHQRVLLLAMSAATIDRRLAPERRRLQIRGRSGTKPGSLLRAQIPIRTFAEWDDARPAFLEADLVAHEGGDPRGDFCQSLDLTCVATGWTEPRALKNKAQRWVFEALKAVRSDLPFPLLGLDSDYADLRIMPTSA